MSVRKIPCVERPLTMPAAPGRIPPLLPSFPPSLPPSARRRVSRDLDHQRAAHVLLPSPK